MLILSRKASQSIVVDDNITITVVGVRGSTVRLGVSAPPNVPVHRHEIQERRQVQARPQRSQLEEAIQLIDRSAGRQHDAATIKEIAAIMEEMLARPEAFDRIKAALMADKQM